MRSTAQTVRVFLPALVLIAAGATAQLNQTVIGPSNADLAAGADALRAGDAEEGVRLTLRGLHFAQSDREWQAAHSNLCAGYLLLNQLDKALQHCNTVLAENDNYWRAYSNRALIYIEQKRYAEAEQDLQKGESISPNARTLKRVRLVLNDAVNPVSPTITIDERRQPADDGDG